jgi:hypothetical protein
MVLGIFCPFDNVGRMKEFISDKRNKDNLKINWRVFLLIQLTG